MLTSLILAALLSQPAAVPPSGLALTQPAPTWAFAPMPIADTVEPE